MNRGKILLNTLTFAFLLCLFFEHPAHAYLDMGTGSYLMQIAVASFLGVIVTIKIYWKTVKEKLASFFSRKKGPPDNEL